MGGPIALVEEGDLIRIDVPNRQLAIVGVNGEEKTPEEMEAILAQRRANWKPKAPKYTKGLLKLYSQHAVSPMKVHIWSKNASFAIKTKNKKSTVQRCFDGRSG